MSEQPVVLGMGQEAPVWTGGTVNHLPLPFPSTYGFGSRQKSARVNSLVFLLSFVREPQHFRGTMLAFQASGLEQIQQRWAPA